MSSDAGQSTAPPSVLVIDDSEIARSEMVRVLQEAGLRAVGISSPIGATRAILTHRADAVVIDIMMPGMRGDRLAALFRGNTRLKDLAVILVSGEVQTELKRISQEVGADDVVQKGRLRELAPAVLRAIQSHKQRARKNG
jgi:PleD family two-component response regulator